MNQTSIFGDDARSGDSAARDRPVPVLVPYPVDKAYSYLVPDGLDVQPGDYVTVPLGKREVRGVVWENGEPAEGEAPAPRQKLKTIIARTEDLPPMPEAHRKFIDWAAQYNMDPKGSVLKMSLSAPSAFEPPPPATGYVLSARGKEAASRPGHSGLTPQRRRILEIMAKTGHARRAAEIADLAGCSPGIVKTMAGKGLLDAVPLRSAAPCRHPSARHHVLALSSYQEQAVARLTEAVEGDAYQTFLLDGVTGAGKTEVYFEAVAAALEKGRQALILLPEIALSNAFFDRFKKRFGCAPALWHSNLSVAQRRAVWRGVAEGETKVVIGARSALFLPFPHLGLIVVDEEHDAAYKQEDGVIYHARDMAVVRASLGAFPLVLVSATPSLETISNAWQGRYQHLHLPDRHGGAQLPEIELVDLRQDRPERQHFISGRLRRALAENLEAGEQSLLFLNRRGYAPLTLCRTCGHRISCPRCTAWLVEHKKGAHLQCHHCGYNVPVPKTCPSCGDAGNFAACGPGVERIFEEARALFPDARIVILASDTAQTPDELRTLLEDIRNRAYDIIIGTQIIAKGHHFPHLTCVGVIDADLGLQGGDLRAAERTYQLLHQVAGRAGRAELPGRVYLQTWMPEHKVMQALASRERDIFLETEAAEREAARMPPVTRLAALIVSGKDESQVRDVSAALGKSAPQGPSIQTYGPAEAPFYRLRGNYRRRLLVRAEKKANIQKAIDDWLAPVKIPSAVRVYIDIDPQSFL